MDRSTPGLPIHHQLLEFTQTHVHRVSDAIHPSHPLLSPSPPAPNPSQHQSLFQWVNSSHEVAKVLQFQLQHHSFQWNPRADLLQNGLVGSPCSPRDSQESSPTPQFKGINSSVLSFLHHYITSKTLMWPEHKTHVEKVVRYKYWKVGWQPDCKLSDFNLTRTLLGGWCHACFKDEETDLGSLNIFFMAMQ